MKKIRSAVAAILLIASLTAVLTIPAYATYQDATVTKVVNGNSFVYTPIRDKDNDRPTYVYITDAPSSYTCVQVVSRYDGVPVNLTTVNANIVGYVMCRIGIKYSVHNVVYENGYRKAQLGLKKANYGSGSLTVTWSPDSLNDYVDAT